MERKHTPRLDGTYKYVEGSNKTSRPRRRRRSTLNVEEQEWRSEA